jgi:hypothetical protein
MPRRAKEVKEKKRFFEVRERKLMWCNSTTDSKVWMGGDEGFFVLF